MIWFQNGHDQTQENGQNRSNGSASTPSTSKCHVEEHDYTPNVSKKLTKTTRLQNSLDISKKLLNSVDVRNNIIEEYYKEKVIFLKKQSAKMDKELQLRKIEVDMIVEIKNMLKRYFNHD